MMVNTLAAQAAYGGAPPHPWRGGGSRTADDDTTSKLVRVRVYGFGDHLQGRAGSGKLLRVPCSRGTDIVLVKGMCVRAVYGNQFDLSTLDYASVRLHLMPDGEEITSAEELEHNDKLVVYISNQPFVGNLASPSDVRAAQRRSAAMPAGADEHGALVVDVPSDASLTDDEPLVASALDSPAEYGCTARTSAAAVVHTVASARRSDQELVPARHAATGSMDGAKRPIVDVDTAGTRSQVRPRLVPEHVVAAEPGQPAAAHPQVDDAASGALIAAKAAVSPVPRRKFKTPVHAKFKRAVNKLLLIRRFNKNASFTTASTSNDAATTAANTEMTGMGAALGIGNSRWARRARRYKVARMMDAYIREQSNVYQYGEQRNAVLDPDDKLPWYLIKPDGNFHLVWDVLMLVFVVYATLLVPVRIGFETHPGPVEVVMDLISDVAFILDVAVNFMTTYKENGIYCRNRCQVATQYLRGWFPIDFLATFPIHWITDRLMDTTMLSNVNRVLRLLRLFKLFRILRLVKLFPKLFTLLETSVKINPAALRFLRSFMMLLMMWHLMGCAYWFFVRLQYNGTALCPEIPGRPSRTCFVNHCLCDIDLTRDITVITVLPDTDTSFYDPNDMDVWVPSPIAANQPFTSQYFIAVFWAVMATTSIGREITPRDLTESLFSTIMILLGLMMYSVVIGSASSALANLDGAAAQRQQMLDRVLGYMRSRHVPRFFQKIVIDYYNHQWSSPSVNDDVLEDLPAALRSKLSMIVNRDLVDRIPVFQFMTVDIYLRTVQRLTCATFMPGEYIITQGDVGDSLYFIKSGKVDAVLPNGVTVFLTLQPGDFFGEHSLLFLTRRDASFRAVDFVDALVLSQSEFTQLYISAPDFIREIQRADKVRQQTRLKCELVVAAEGGPARAAPTLTGAEVTSDTALTSPGGVGAPGFRVTTSPAGKSKAGAAQRFSKMVRGTRSLLGTVRRAWWQRRAGASVAPRETAGPAAELPGAGPTHVHEEAAQGAAGAAAIRRSPREASSTASAHAEAPDSARRSQHEQDAQPMLISPAIRPIRSLQSLSTIAVSSPAPAPPRSILKSPLRAPATRLVQAARSPSGQGHLRGNPRGLRPLRLPDTDDETTAEFETPFMVHGSENQRDVANGVGQSRPHSAESAPASPPALDSE